LGLSVTAEKLLLFVRDVPSSLDYPAPTKSRKNTVSVMEASHVRILALYIRCAFLFTMAHAFITSAPSSTAKGLVFSPRAVIQVSDNSTYFPSKVETRSQTSLNEAPSVVFVTSTPKQGTVNQTIIQTVPAFQNSTTSAAETTSTPTTPAVLTGPIGGNPTASTSNKPSVQNIAPSLEVGAIHVLLFAASLFSGVYMLW
jgi:hypothetical protein